MSQDPTPPDRVPKPPDARRFFVVWSPQGGPPMARLETFKAARSAAVRLSQRHPDRDFFVLQSCWGKVGIPAAGVVGPEVADSEAP